MIVNVNPPSRCKASEAGNAKGFSLVELMIVVVAMSVATAMAVPMLLSARNGYQLRTATVDLTSPLQKSRMFCIQNNRAISVQTVAGGTQVYLDSNNNGAYDAGELMILLPANTTQTNAGAPAIPAATLGFAAAQNPPARFDGRGLPCLVNAAGACSNWSTASNAAVGFVYYLKQVSNGTRWSAVSITPGGQVKTWSYSGGVWVNR